jgi:putative transposase
MYGYRVSIVLRIVGVSRSTYYYWLQPSKTKETHDSKPVGRPIPGYCFTKQGKKVSDEQIKEWIMEAIAGDGYSYGYVKLTYHLRQEYGLVINKKRVYRLCKELDILKPQRERKFIYPRKLARNREITAPNQLWEVDIKYGYITGEDRFFYVLSYLDVFDRQIVGYHIGLRCEAKHAAQVLQEALWKRQVISSDGKPVIRSDNGPQFVSLLFASACQEFGVEHERIPPKTPNMNAHIEAFHRWFEEDCLSRSEFQTYEEAYRAVVEYMEYYNNRRIHSSLHYLSPKTFYQQHMENGLMPVRTIHV